MHRRVGASRFENRNTDQAERSQEMTEIVRKPIFGRPVDGKPANDGYRCELCGHGSNTATFARCWRTSAAASCENLVRQPMIIDEPEPEVGCWDEAEAALAAAQQMPGGLSELPRSRKPDNLDSEPTSAQGDQRSGTRVETRIGPSNQGAASLAIQLLLSPILRRG